MRDLSKIKFSYFSFRTAEGKRRLIILLIIVVILAGIGGGFYLYLNNLNKKFHQKFTQAQNLYFEAKTVQEQEKKVEKLKKAAQIYQEVIQQRFWSGNREEAFFYLANTFYELGDYQESIRVLEEFRKKFPDSYFSPWANLKLALIYEKTEKYQEALELYENIGQRYPQSSVAPEALLGQARCQEYLNNEKEAIKIYRTLVSRYPLSAQAALGEAKLQELTLKEKKG